MKENTVVKAKDGCYYKVRYRDSGFVHKEDKGLWRCLKVDWDGDHFGTHDDDDWMLDNEGNVLAHEIGWDLRRVKIQNDRY